MVRQLAGTIKQTKVCGVQTRVLNTEITESELKKTSDILSQVLVL